MSLPPDVGELVTNEEVVAFVAPMNNTIGILEESVILAAEDMVQDYCQRRFLSQEYEDEPYLIRRTSTTFDGWTTSARTEIRLKQRPVTEFTSLKHVVSRNESDGEPNEVSTLPRNLYRIDLAPGIIVFNYPLITADLGTYYGSFPQAFLVGSNQVIDLLATYTAGFEEVPARVKLAVNMVIYRIYMMTLQQNWHRTESQTTGAMTIWQSFIREGLTPEEKMILDRFKTPIAA